LIKQLEGFVSHPSPDPVGVPTVGYGHQCRQPGCTEITQRLPLSPEDADLLLRQDIGSYVAALEMAVDSRVTMNDNQWGALVSWAYNVGTESVRHSELVRRLNQGLNPETIVRQELPKWVSVNNIRLPGLVKRRAEEINLFLKTPSTRS
ncbi:hypothetical protein GGI05_004231, partial [Coemansia sp. RSA 2603]